MAQIMDYNWKSVCVASRLNTVPVIDFVGNVFNTVGSVITTTGFYSGGILFNGELGNYVHSVLTNFSPTGAGFKAWTIEGYAKCSTPINSRAGIFFFGDITSNVDRLQFEITPTFALSLYSNLGSVTFINTADNVVTPGQEFHWAVTRNRDYCCIYVNGVLVGSGIIDFSSNTELNHCFLGVSRNGGLARSLNGSMAEVRITNRVVRYGTSYTPENDLFWFDAYKTYSGSVIGLSSYPAKVTFLTENCETIDSVLTELDGTFTIDLPVSSVRAICDSDSPSLNSIILDGIVGV